MKKSLILLLVVFLFNACQFDKKIDLEAVENPEEDIYELFDGFELESMYLADHNYDGFLDYEFVGYDMFDNYVDVYFMHNGEGSETYTFMDYEDFWYAYETYEDTYSRVEDYFAGMEEESSIEEIYYSDLTNDGMDDAVVVSYYTSDDYYSIDVYIFEGGENGYTYFGLGEMHYPVSEDAFDVFQNVTIKDEFFTVELAEPGEWERYITFKYDEFDQDFLLYKDGGKIWDENGELLRDEVLTDNDFGYVFFYEFNPNDGNVFSLQIPFWVSNTEELLAAIGSNRVIYIQGGEYLLNDLDALPEEARANFYQLKGWSTFYSSSFYKYEGYGGANESEINLTLGNVRNTSFIGEGDVRFVVDDEFVTVLALEDCDKVVFENIYMVHDVGGVCGANVVDMYYSDEVDFINCVFDGSGEIGVYSEDCYSMYFIECSFTNCTSGALDCFDSDAMFRECYFKDNLIWHTLVGAYGYSTLDFYECEFTDNSDESYDSSNDSYLFYTDDEAYIYLDSYSILENNQVNSKANNRDNITLPM